MISGVVTANGEAIIRLELLGPDGGRREIEAVMDTGFNGFLTLPNDVISALGLPLAGDRRATLADESEVSMDMHLAHIIWHEGREYDILVLRAEGGPLLGMELLHGNRVVLDVIEDGDVSINALS